MGSTFHAYIHTDGCALDSPHRGQNQSPNQNQKTSKQSQLQTNATQHIKNVTVPTIQLYPNPNTGQFTFVTQSNLTTNQHTLTIYSLTGQMVYTQ